MSRSSKAASYSSRRRSRCGSCGGCLGRLLVTVLVLAVVAGLVVFLPGLLDTRHRIVLDPGHGGGDPGAPGIVTESEMTDRTAALLAEMLEEQGSFKVTITRTPEESASIRERVRTARFARAQLFLSIHGNSAEDPAASGFECYPVPPGRENHSESLTFGTLLAEEMEKAGAFLRGSDGIRYAYYLEDDSKELVDGSDTRVRIEPSFGVLDSAGCPAVLAEQCFVTNEADVDAFGDEDGCAAAAAAYYQAILRWFGEET